MKVGENTKITKLVFLHTTTKVDIAKCNIANLPLFTKISDFTKITKIPNYRVYTMNSSYFTLKYPFLGPCTPEIGVFRGQNRPKIGQFWGVFDMFSTFASFVKSNYPERDFVHILNLGEKSGASKIDLFF